MGEGAALTPGELRRKVTRMSYNEQFSVEDGRRGLRMRHLLRLSESSLREFVFDAGQSIDPDDRRRGQLKYNPDALPLSVVMYKGLETEVSLQI